MFYYSVFNIHITSINRDRKANGVGINGVLNFHNPLSSMFKLIKNGTIYAP